LASLDERLLHSARTRLHCARAERAVAGFSRLGEHGAVWLALGALGASIDRRRRERWRSAMAAVGCAYALNTAVKLLVRRRRPSLPGLPALTSTPTAMSFPSAHAATSFAGALRYSRLGLPRVPLYALALALSTSRVYLGVHYPSDVIGGALLGTVVGRGVSTRRDRRRGPAVAQPAP
jgi:decaprenylphosphoryl-5-phosphoribose phosphatase